MGVFVRVGGGGGGVGWGGGGGLITSGMCHESAKCSDMEAKQGQRVHQHDPTQHFFVSHAATCIILLILGGKIP